MIRGVLLALLLIGGAFRVNAQTITAAEYFVGADPGVGLGTPITVSTPDDEVPLAWSVATGSLAAHRLHRVNVRVRTNSGQWSAAHQCLLAVTANDGVAWLITQLEYQVDNGPFTLVDLPDGPSVAMSELVSTAGLSDGLHRLRVRATDNTGRVSQLHDGFFVVEDNVFQSRVVTLLQYWYDSDAPTTVDVADAATVNWNEVLNTDALPIGLHSLNVRAIDNAGRVGSTHRAFLIVTGAFVAGQPRNITAAEYFVNVDPGAGNGVAIPLPDDGAYDEGEEDVTQVLTNLPIGLHLVGMRVRDNAGRWSQAVTDSILVGPVLTIRSVNNDIILDWASSNGVAQFYIYRANNVSGAYALIDSTVNQTYTDPGIVGSQLRQFYNVTFRAAALSNYRVPDAPVEAVKD